MGHDVHIQIIFPGRFLKRDGPGTTEIHLHGNIYESYNHEKGDHHHEKLDE